MTSNFYLKRVARTVPINFDGCYGAPSNSKYPEVYPPGLEFQVASQGSVRLRIKALAPFRIILNDTANDSQGTKPVYVLEVTETSYAFRNKNDDQPTSFLAQGFKKEGLLEKNTEVNYWFSLDKKNGLLKYGKGDATQSLTLFTCSVDKKTIIPGLKYIGIYTSTKGEVLKSKVYQLPVTIQLPPFVAPHDGISLEDIEAGVLTSIGNLPTECQNLYAVVAGNKVTLDPLVATAIQKSLTSTTGALYKKCVQKAQEHHTKLTETYLRVTLGLDMGYSPGVPFVLEIWPSGHESPIHQHSDAYAVIKVLSGEIHCQYFSDLRPEVLTPYMECNFTQNQITYLTPYIYQTHRLQNRKTDSFCATIQCYKYAHDDTIHYEYFDFLNDKNVIDKFTPNTDYTYAGLLEVLRKEGTLPPKTKPYKTKTTAVQA
eukprot:gene8490-10435_t